MANQNNDPDKLSLSGMTGNKGGAFSGVTGGSAASGGRILAAANKALHQAALARLAGRTHRDVDWDPIANGAIVTVELARA